MANVYAELETEKKSLSWAMMFPVPQCTEESHVSSCFPAKSPGPNGCFWTPVSQPRQACHTWWLHSAAVRWARDRAALSAFVLRSSTVNNTKFWEADNTRQSTLCHSFTHQLSESTCKPIIQHLIKAPLKSWTESTVYTELCSKPRTGAVQGAMEKHAAQKHPCRMDSLKAR